MILTTTISKNRFLPLVALLVLIPPLAGCQSGGGDDGIDESAVAKAQEPLITAAKRAGGDWSKLMPDEQKLFLDRARGNEGTAKSMVGLMAGRVPDGPKKK